ncbi:MAG: glycosyltransferase [Bacteroidales bacterium]|nr:glycosyltransferase [Bacteroidales bacterium]
MEIVIIGSAYPLRGGLAAYNERLADEYQRQGMEVVIYSFTLQYPSILFPGKSQYSDEPAPEKLVIHTRINSINPLNWIRIGNEIRKLKPDLVVVKFWMPFMAPCLGTICRIIHRNKHTRIISIIDNIIPHEKRPGDRMLASYFVRSVDGFVAMSGSVVKELEQFDQQKPKIFAPHPLYDHFGDPLPKQEAMQRIGLDPAWQYILFFGFIRDYKGLDLLLKAFANPGIRELNVKLLVAGEFYCDPSPYRKIIEEHGLDDLVIMSNDFIPDSKVRDYFCAADLVVQPYKSATQSGVTQIAYHFNKPMIITDVGGLSEIVPDGKAGYVVAPDPQQIADAIIRFYRENKEQEFAKHVAIEKEKYSWRKMLEAIETLYVGCKM